MGPPNSSYHLESSRFETLVEQLKSRDADGLWVSLGSCDLHDSSMATVKFLPDQLGMQTGLCRRSDRQMDISSRLSRHASDESLSTAAHRSACKQHHRHFTGPVPQQHHQRRRQGAFPLPRWKNSWRLTPLWHPSDDFFIAIVRGRRCSELWERVQPRI